MFLKGGPSMATVNYVCPNCDQPQYELDTDSWGLVQLGDDDTITSATVFPVSVISCLNCGYVQLYNKSIAGELTLEPRRRL